MASRFVFNNSSNTNAFIKFLEKSDPPLVDVLKHELLGTTVRNESKQLINYFFPPSEMAESSPSLPHLDELLDFALSNKYADPDLKIYQLNRNASNILAHNFTKFIKCAVADPCKRVSLRLRSFINDNDNNKNPFFCGHYQRIVENYLRNAPEELTADYEDGFTLEKLADFIIQNVSILPYRELLSDIMSEFAEMFGDELPNIVLRAAARAVFSIPRFMKNNFNRSHQFSLSSALKSHKYTVETLKPIQPINISRKLIPLPDFLYNVVEDDSMAPAIVDESFLKEQQKFVGFDPNSPCKYTSLEQIVQHVFCLLSSIRLAAIGQTQIIQDLQNEDSIRLLLICGIYSDSNSAISTEAFKLLRHVFYGYDDISRMEKIPNIVNSFAANFTFEPDAMTTQMFAAFPIFWNFRYKTITSENEYQVIDPHQSNNRFIKEYPLNMFKKTYSRPEGKTPLEFLTPIFFSEPPLNTTFNIRFMEILDRLNKDRLDLYGEESDISKLSREAKQKVLEIDLIYFEFLRNKFDLNKDIKNINVDEALEIVTPLVTTDKFFHPDSSMTPLEEQQKMHRVPLNGQILKLHQFIMTAKLLDPSDSDPGVFYNFIPERNKHSNQYFNAKQQYEKLMDYAEKNAVILESLTSPPIVDELDVR